MDYQPTAEAHSPDTTDEIRVALHAAIDQLPADPELLEAVLTLLRPVEQTPDARPRRPERPQRHARG